MFHSLYLVFALQPVSCVSPCVVGEALQCNNCVREAPDSGNCAETVETCPPEMDACAKITYPAPHENTFHKSCFKMAECLKLAFTQGLKVSCCNWDGCNK
uniref:CD59 glycoprotein-like n=1 Tax=Sparus aurata TaxID=8175 RepID=A0A671YF43_SPAAU